MSLGFIPVVLSILSCRFTTQDLAIYIGAGAGLLLSIYSMRPNGRHIPQIILYGTTGMLLLLSAAALLLADYCPDFLFPFTLEISALIPPFVLFLNRRRVREVPVFLTRKWDKRLFGQGAEAAIVSARVILLITLLHVLAIFLTIGAGYPPGSTARHLLFQVAPPLVFVSAILFNQFGIHYFNSVMSRTLFVPIVNTRGDVTGKAIASEAITGRKSDHIHPFIRIAVASHGMLYLLPRSPHDVFERGKTDLPMEGCLIYGETLEQGVHRILGQTLPDASLEHLHFNFMHHFENEAANRLIYLFTLDLDDDTLLSNKDAKGGKLWTLRQMEQNLGQGFFSSCLEQEFEALKEIIGTREKYRES